MTHKHYIPAMALLSLSAVAIAPVTAHAQTRLPRKSVQTKSPRISLYLRDVPVRTALAQVFNKAGVQHAIDPMVTGNVTLRIRNQSLENAVRLILRSATTPVSYTRESNVYIVKARQTAPALPGNTSNIASDVADPQLNAPMESPYTYYDPYYSNPVPRGPIVMGGSSGFGNVGGLGAGGTTIFLGGGGFGMPYYGIPYWGGFGDLGSYRWPTNGYFFGGFDAGNLGGNNGSFGNANGGFGNIGGFTFGGRAF